MDTDMDIDMDANPLKGRRIYKSPAFKKYFKYPKRRCRIEKIFNNI